MINEKYNEMHFEEEKQEPKVKVKIPISDIASLGVDFEPISELLMSVANSNATNSGYFRVTWPEGTHLASRLDKSGNIGTALSDANNKIAGQATMNKVVVNPTMMFMAIAVANIDKKLNDIKDMQEELIDYLIRKDKSEIRGDIAFMNDVAQNYKYNYDNEQYKTNNHIKMLDIKQSSEQKILFFKEEILKNLKIKGLFHSSGDVKEKFEEIKEQFKEYQLSNYMFAFSSFLEVLLLENYAKDYLKSVIDKIEEYTYEYREVYTKTYDKIKEYTDSSVQAKVIGGLAVGIKGAGKVIEKTPIGRTQLDESLQSTGEGIKEKREIKAEEFLDQLIEFQSNNVKPFIENIGILMDVYNSVKGIVFDRDSVYIEQAEK